MIVKLAIATTAFLTMAAGTALAGRICVPVPEIDGPSGLAAMSLFVSFGLLAYNRSQRK